MNLVDVRTTYVNRHSVNEDIYHGIYIDVIPFEGCPSSKVERALQIYHSIMFSVFNVQRLPDNQGSFCDCLLKFYYLLLDLHKAVIRFGRNIKIK